MPDRTFAGELHRAHRAHVIEDAAGTAGAVETVEREHLAGDEPARLFGVHHPGQRRRDHSSGRDGPQHKTRKHCNYSDFTQAAGDVRSLYPLLTILTVATLSYQKQDMISLGR